jgi:hypothetical protein
MTLDYGNETIIRLAGGATLRCDSYDENPQGASYLRVCDPAGEEIAYWTAEEWREDPELVIGAFMGAADKAQEAEC